jgi:hypothetical protein
MRMNKRKKREEREMKEEGEEREGRTDDGNVEEGQRFVRTLLWHPFVSLEGVGHRFPEGVAFAVSIAETFSIHSKN